MGTYKVPRNTKGESRILVIFSMKALGYSMAGLIIGYIIKFILKLIGLNSIGIAIMVILALVGYSIATFKIPNINSKTAISQIAGENIDDIIIRYMKHNKNKKRIYIAQTKEEAEFNGK